MSKMPQGESAIRNYKKSEFELLPDGVPNLGLSPDAHWFLPPLKNSTQSQEFILTQSIMHRLTI